MIVRPRPKRSVLPPLRKKRKIDHNIEEINFDDTARADYLTGFHKRKVQRTKRAQEEAEKKAREERITMRKQVCAESACFVIHVNHCRLVAARRTETGIGGACQSCECITGGCEYQVR